MTIEFEVRQSPKSDQRAQLKMKKFISCWDQLMYAAQNSGATWNGRDKTWTVSFINLDMFVEGLQKFDLTVKLYWYCQKPTPLKEKRLVRIHEKFDPNLLKSPPLEGKAPYEDYQAEDIERAINTNRFLFNWGTGCGKSYALSYILQRARNKNIANKFIILTTKVGCLNLKDEILGFTRTFKEDEIYTIDSVQGVYDRDIFKKCYNVIIINYNTLRHISDYYYGLNHHSKNGAGVNYKSNQLPITEWLGDKPGFLFLDESHNISSATSKQSKIVQYMYEECNLDYRYEFTGTFATKFEGMYPQLRLLDKYLVRYCAYTEWCGLYNTLGTKYSPFAINPKGWKQDKLEKLNELVFREYAVKRRSKEVLPIEDTVFVPPYYIPMSEDHRKIYKDFVEEYFHLLQEDTDNKNNQKVTLSNMVRANIIAFQACVDNPKSLINNKRFSDLSMSLQNRLNRYDFEEDSPKVEYLLSILEDRVGYYGEKGIVWYDHPSTGEALVKLLSKKYSVTHISSGTSEMKKVVDAFKEDPKSNLLVASLRVMNTSVTITQCKFNVWVERTYSPITYEQCLGRIARYGQEDVTRNYVLAYKDSLDKLQDMILTKGETILDKTLDKDFLSVNDWALLLNGKVDGLI